MDILLWGIEAYLIGQLVRSSSLKYLEGYEKIKDNEKAKRRAQQFFKIGGWLFVIVGRLTIYFCLVSMISSEATLGFVCIIIICELFSSFYINRRFRVNKVWIPIVNHILFGLFFLLSVLTIIFM